MYLKNSKKNENPDVLKCLADLSNEEVFTSPNIAKKIINQLPDPIWSNPKLRFLDPCCKSGVFLREIATKLIDGLEKKIPNLQDRINHIMQNQVFGIAITELTAMLSRRSLYCSKKANSKKSIPTTIKNEEGNIFYKEIHHDWHKDNCISCGVKRELYDKIEVKETHAYNFIHKNNLIGKMQFDVIIGNPPYHVETGGHGKAAKPLYHLFIKQALKLSPRYLSMIIPSRWFAGGLGLDEFRKDMLNDKRIKLIVDYVDSKQCFDGVDIPGGVMYFLWDKHHDGDCEVVTHFNKEKLEKKRKLNTFEFFIRFPTTEDIVKKVKKYDKSLIWHRVYGTSSFGIGTNEKPDRNGEIKLFYSGGTGPLKLNRVKQNVDIIDKWKVITSKASYDHAGQPDSKGKRKVFSKLEIIPPKTVCSQTYFVVGIFESKNEAEIYLKYLKTKFVRFLIAAVSFSHDVNRKKFMLVPDYEKYKNLNDKEIFDKMSLSENEKKFINNSIHNFD